MGRRFNPAPGWPPPPPGFVPPPHWQPDPSWPPAPPGWQLWVDDSTPDPRQATGPQARAGGAPAGPVGRRARPEGFGGEPAGGVGTVDAPYWDALSDPPSGPLTGPPTQAYVPGGTGPQDPFGPGDPFIPHAPPGPADDLDGSGRPGRHAGTGKADGFAVASLVLGSVGITVIGAVLGIVFGVTALRRIRRTGQHGRGMAIAGLVFSVIWLLLIGAFVTLGTGMLGTGKGSGQSPASVGTGSSPGAQPGSTAQPGSAPTAKPSSSVSPGSPSTNVFALRPGQCFQNPPDSQTVLGLTYVTVVPCTKPHNAQAFVQFTAKGTGWPGTAALKQQADSGCHARIKGNVRASEIKSSMTLHYLYPLQASWAGHRTITCLIVNSTADLTTSLLKAHPAGH